MTVYKCHSEFRPLTRNSLPLIPPFFKHPCQTSTFEPVCYRYSVTHRLTNSLLVAVRNVTAGLTIHVHAKNKNPMKALFIILALSATTLLAITVRAHSAGTAPADRPDRDEKAIRKTVDDARAAFDKHA